VLKSHVGFRKVHGAGWVFACQWWIIRGILAALLIPTLYLTYRAFKRVLPNSCPHCHYDLTGLPIDSPCPECGRAQPRPTLL